MCIRHDACRTPCMVLLLAACMHICTWQMFTKESALLTPLHDWQQGCTMCSALTSAFCSSLSVSDY